MTLVLSLTACGGKNASDTSSQGAGSSQPTEDVSTQENNKPDNGSLIVAADGLESMGEAQRCSGAEPIKMRQYCCP